MARRRRPIVSVAGETRSKGSVSQAGKRSTQSKPTKAARSWVSWSASLAVGVATRTPGALPSSEMAAMASARAASGMATTASSAASRSAMTASPASRRGRALSVTTYSLKRPRTVGRAGDEVTGRAGCEGCGLTFCRWTGRGPGLRGLRAHGFVLKRFMAPETPSVAIASMASAATSTATSMSSRSFFDGRFST